MTRYRDFTSDELRIQLLALTVIEADGSLAEGEHRSARKLKYEARQELAERAAGVCGECANPAIRGQ